MWKKCFKIGKFTNISNSFQYSAIRQMSKTCISLQTFIFYRCFFTFFHETSAFCFGSRHFYTKLGVIFELNSLVTLHSALLSNWIQKKFTSLNWNETIFAESSAFFPWGFLLEWISCYFEGGFPISTFGFATISCNKQLPAGDKALRSQSSR